LNEETNERNKFFESSPEIIAMQVKKFILQECNGKEIPLATLSENLNVSYRSLLSKKAEFDKFEDSAEAGNL